MAQSKFERIYVPKHCGVCGKEEFEGFVFGQWRTRHLQAQSGDRQILCKQCEEDRKPKFKPTTMFDNFVVPAVTE